MSTRPPAEADGGHERSARARSGQDAHRLVLLEGRQDQRPARARRSSSAAPAGPGDGTPSTIACSTDETCSMSRRTGVSGAVPAGTRSGASPAVPTDSRGMTTSPASSAAASMAMASRPSRTSNGTASRPILDRPPLPSVPQLQAGPAQDERPVGVVLELVLGVHASADPHVARRSLAQRERLGDADRRRRREQATRPGSAARTCAARPHPATSASRPGDEGDQGGHGGDDSAGHERARRNLPDTWALMRSPPLVSLGPSGLGRTVGGATSPDAMGAVHRMSPDAPGYPPAVHTALRGAGGPSAGSRELSCRHSRSARAARRPSPPPTTTSECATRQATVPSGSMANVSSSAWTMTWASRDEPSSAMIGVAGPMLPAGLAGRHVQPERVEPVAHDQQAVACPSGPRAARR